MPGPAFPNPARQRGAALLFGLLVLGIAGSALLLWRLNGDPGITERNTTAALALAKEALIGTAASGDLASGRPGQLPCPDTNDDGNAEPSCSTQASRLGRLPWRTLGLPDLRDGSGERLWYAVSTNYKNNPAIGTLNSDTPGSITVRDGRGNAIFDASIGTGAVAVVIAPGSPLTRPSSASDPTPYQQSRFGAGSNAAINYLDAARGEDNANFSDLGSNGLIAGSIVDTDGRVLANDRLLVIGREEIMAAVERRVAGELKSCVVMHAESPLNDSHRFPWPAPLSVADYSGKAGSYFGLVPQTQPGNSPEASLRQTLDGFEQARSAIASAGTAADQLTAVQSLAALAGYAKEFFYLLDKAAKDLYSRSDVVRTAAGALDSGIDLALANGSLSTGEKKSVKDNSTGLQTKTENLLAALANTGIDAFPPELAARKSDMQAALDAAAKSPSASGFNSLKAKSEALLQLLAAASTANPDVAAALNAAFAVARQSGTDAANAAAAPGDAVKSGVAIASAKAAIAAASGLLDSIAANRVSLSAGVIQGYGASIDATAAQLEANPSAALADLLAERETEFKEAIDAMVTAATTVIARRDAASLSLAAAIAAIRSAGVAPGNYSEALAAAAAATADSARLAAAVLGNGDNLTQYSLQAARDALSANRSAFESSASIVNARALADSSSPLQYWADLIARQANDIKIQAFESSSPKSAFDAAKDTLASIVGASGSAASLEAYLANPGDALLQSRATSRLATTVSRLDTLIASAGKLAGSVAASSGEAFPLVWLSSAGRCDFLNSGNTDSWWNANGWGGLVFYQIGTALGSAPGSLRVNGAGAYRVVALAAGRSLADQNRSVRTAMNYLEGANADTSRNGDAGSPSREFSDRGFSYQFNDRLAY